MSQNGPETVSVGGLVKGLSNARLRPWMIRLPEPRPTAAFRRKFPEL